LKKLGVTKKPHELMQKIIVDRIDAFLKRMVTADEKWVTYDNVSRKRSWSKSGEADQTVAKPGLTARKVFLCVWWD